MSNEKKKGDAPAATGRGVLWKVALYIRLSKEDGKDESESVVNQKKILEAYMETRVGGPYEIAGYYVDDGLTGTDDTRADFMRMIQDIEQGRVNCVICKTLARAFRNYSDQGYYLEYYFQQKKVRFISLAQPAVDTHRNPEAVTNLEIPITGLMNDRFAATTSENVRRTLDMKRKRGEFIGAFAPYGFQKDPNDKNRLILDGEIVPIKRDMLRWYIADGMSLAAIARRLNELGIPNPSAYKRSKGAAYHHPHMEGNRGMWVASTVKRVLANKNNIGHLVQGRQRVVSYKVHDVENLPPDRWYEVPDKIEPTFTQREYDALMGLLARDTRTQAQRKQVFLFGGFLRCADCGKAMQRKTSKGYVYYVCRTYSEKSKSACSRHAIREADIERAVLEAVRLQLQLLRALSDIAEEVAASPATDTRSSRLEKLLQERTRELKRARSTMDGLYDDYKRDLITLEEYKRMKAKYRDLMDRCAASVRRLEEERRQARDEAAPEDGPFKAFLEHRTIRRLDRAILAETVESILIGEGKRILIRFKFKETPMQ